jgi:hypothetical protein
MVKILGIVMAVLFAFCAVGIAIESNSGGAWDYLDEDEDSCWEEDDNE